MGCVRKLTIEGYRSIGDRIEITFPDGVPLVLIGENNAGKSNIVRALDLVLGEFWPGSHDPDDHEFYGRKKADGLIEIVIEVDGVSHVHYGNKRAIKRLIWRYPSDDKRPFRMAYKSGEETAWVSNDVRDQCTCIVVNADRRLSYQLGFSSKYTFLSKLTKKFHQCLSGDAARVQDLEKKYEEIKTLYQEVDQFSIFTAELERQVGELSGNLAYGLGIGFTPYDPSNYFRSLRVQPREGDQPRTFEELGTGQEQILAICFAHAYASTFHSADGLLLVIEEPEAHLHPLAQRWLGQKVHELAEQGAQVVITTHSPAFLNMLGLEGFVRVCKRDDSTEVVQLTKRKLAEHCAKSGAAGASESGILPFYAPAATEEILAGLFARRIVLVEGPTESLALPIYLAHFGVQPARDGVAVIPVGGVGNLAKWWRLFTAYGIPCYIVFDNDSKHDKEGVRRRDILQTLDVAVDQIDDLLRANDWVIDDRFCVFGMNFEKTMRSWFGDAYTELERKAKEGFGLSADQSKPLVARFVAEQLPRDQYPEGWERFEALANCIANLRLPGEQTGVSFNGYGDYDDLPFG